MSPHLLKELCDRRTKIRERWERLLREEPVRSALAMPDTLVHLIPESLDAMFRSLAKRRDPPLSIDAARAIKLPMCGCGRNPYLAYFDAGEQALVAEVELVQNTMLPDHRNPTDVALAIRAARRLAVSELETFCSVCVHRGESVGCRFHVAAAN